MDPRGTIRGAPRAVGAAELAFPPAERWGTPRRWRAHGLRGRAYADSSPALDAAVARWLEEGSVAEGEPLKPPHVFKAGGLVVKFFPPPTVFGWARRPRALRVAALHFRALPVASPRPLLACARWRGGPSLLVREHVEGALLSAVWSKDERARSALPRFLADLELHGVLHGDLHPRNLIWDGERWVLLDVDGIRHGLHDRARVIEGQWARFLAHLGDEPGLERAFGATRALTRGPGDRSGREDWDRIRERAAVMVREIRAASLARG
jgi:hypothetical protein